MCTPTTDDSSGASFPSKMPLPREPDNLELQLPRLSARTDYYRWQPENHEPETEPASDSNGNSLTVRIPFRLGTTGPNGELGICADFARNVVGTAFLGFQRVSIPDLDILAMYYMVKEPKVGKPWPGVPADCLPGNRAPAP